MIITPEPYFTVRVPSEVVVLEDDVRKNRRGTDLPRSKSAEEARRQAEATAAKEAQKAKAEADTLRAKEEAAKAEAERSRKAAEELRTRLRSNSPHPSNNTHPARFKSEYGRCAV